MAWAAQEEEKERERERRKKIKQKLNKKRLPYVSLNRWVFKAFLKAGRDAARRSSLGSWFHSVGPTTEKARLCVGDFRPSLGVATLSERACASLVGLGPVVLWEIHSAKNPIPVLK